MNFLEEYISTGGELIKIIKIDNEARNWPLI
jgi:hypothetical protein